MLVVLLSLTSPADACSCAPPRPALRFEVTPADGARDVPPDVRVAAHLFGATPTMGRLRVVAERVRLVDADWADVPLDMRARTGRVELVPKQPLLRERTYSVLRVHSWYGDGLLPSITEPAQSRRSSSGIAECWRVASTFVVGDGATDATVKLSKVELHEFGFDNGWSSSCGPSRSLDARVQVTGTLPLWAWVDLVDASGRILDTVTGSERQLSTSSHMCGEHSVDFAPYQKHQVMARLGGRGQPSVTSAPHGFAVAGPARGSPYVFDVPLNVTPLVRPTLGPLEGSVECRAATAPPLGGR